MKSERKVFKDADGRNIIKMTEDDYKKFKKWCEFWIKNSGLTDWGSFYSWSEDQGELARVVYTLENKVCCLMLNKEWTAEIKKEDLNVDDSVKYVSLHEVCHLLLADLTMALCKFYSKDYVDQMEHSVINRIENLVRFLEKNKGNS